MQPATEAMRQAKTTMPVISPGYVLYLVVW